LTTGQFKTHIPNICPQGVILIFNRRTSPESLSRPAILPLTTLTNNKSAVRGYEAPEIIEYRALKNAVGMPHGISDERFIELVFDPSHRMARSFTNSEKIILWRVLCYYNRLSIETKSGDSYSIGEERPPSFRDLMRPDPFEIQDLRKARERLVEQEILKSDPVHICRTEINYAPTKRGRKVMDELHADAFEEIIGEAAYQLEAIDTDSVLGGEQNEGLAHRYGVCQIGWAFRGRITLYPQGSGPQPDILTRFEDHPRLLGEVLTGHNGYQQIVEKYEAFAQRQGTKVWLFPDAEIAARMINLLERRVDNFHCKNATFTNPGNYRPHRLNDYLSRPQSRTPGMDTIHTFASLYDHEIASSD
jgi:hypothetical protein